MFVRISQFILRNRVQLIIFLAIITAFMAYKAKDIEMNYEYASLLAEKNQAKVEYNQFKKIFGEDGNLFVIGIQNPNLFQLDQFNEWYDLSNQISQLEGVDGVISITRMINLKKNNQTHQFDIVPLIDKRPTTQAEVDSLKDKILSLKFYDGFLYNPQNQASLMAITLDKTKMNSKKRIDIVNSVTQTANQYKERNKLEMHFSGMPYISTLTMYKVKKELFLFVLGSILIAAFIMYLFFRSFKIVLSSLLVVGVSIIWVLGTLTLFGFKITILTGVIPSLVVIIVIENCIYILNKYHWEYRAHGNKARALSNSIQRIGFASLMTNAATALGFAAFIVIPNKMLREFGVVTSINIIGLYVLCIVLLPIIFSYLAPPSQKNVKHLENSFFKSIVDKIIELITHKRKAIYVTALILLVIGLVGISEIKTSGKSVDDLKKNDPIYVDLKFFENNFGGVMPFEISIDTKKKNGAFAQATLTRMDELQKVINQNPEFSKPLSIAELFKFSKQAFYSGDSSKYDLPNSMERTFILSYLPQNVGEGKSNLLNSYIDSTRQTARISYQMADVGTKKMEALLAKIKPKADSIFDPEKYEVHITGNSVVYALGTNFLIKNLFESVMIAIVLISLLMALLFSSFKMILVSMIPNIIPLLITAAIMGFTGVPLKPSTLIVFSVGLGISVDNAIQYLSRYRHELKHTNGQIKQSAINALHEAGFSMIYTSIVLVLGFSVFMFSGFGATQALGILISATLFIAMFFNILVLPSLLLTLDKRLTSKAFIEPIIEIYDDENDDENENIKNSTAIE
ncbi:MAG TPA: efflux RND transporter permease subunit [Prolixibacteraceae bacterium]|nr:efflux RND transporter permease subunit [Prolixibacteraceae bacterium]